MCTCTIYIEGDHCLDPDSYYVNDDDADTDDGDEMEEEKGFWETDFGKFVEVILVILIGICCCCAVAGYLGLLEPVMMICDILCFWR